MQCTLCYVCYAPFSSFNLVCGLRIVTGMTHVIEPCKDLKNMSHVELNQQFQEIPRVYLVVLCNILGSAKPPAEGLVKNYPRWVLKSTVWIGTLELERRCPHLGFSCSPWCHQTEVISRNSKPCGEAIADASKGGSGGVESTNYSDPQFAEFVYNSINC